MNKFIWRIQFFCDVTLCRWSVLKDCNGFIFMEQMLDPWKWRHCNLLKCQKQLSQQKSITSQNAWIHSNTNAKTSTLAKLVHFWGTLHFANQNIFVKFPTVLTILKTMQHRVSFLLRNPEHPATQLFTVLWHTGKHTMNILHFVDRASYNDSWWMTKVMHKSLLCVYFYLQLSTCFEHTVLIIRRDNCFNTASVNSLCWWPRCVQFGRRLPTCTHLGHQHRLLPEAVLKQLSLLMMSTVRSKHVESCK